MDGDGATGRGAEAGSDANAAAAAAGSEAPAAADTEAATAAAAATKAAAATGEGAGAEAGGDAVAVAERLRVALDDLVRTLTASGARTEALGAFEQRRSILGIRRGPVLVPITRVWRLGVLLLDAQGGLHEVGAVTRAIDPGRVTNQSARAEERRDYRRAAYQGKFERGDTVNYDTTPVALDAAALRAGSGPLSLVGDTVLVRWNKQPGAAGLTPVVPYLAERAALLTAPLP